MEKVLWNLNLSSTGEFALTLNTRGSRNSNHGNRTWNAHNAGVGNTRHARLYAVLHTSTSKTLKPTTFAVSQCQVYMAGPRTTGDVRTLHVSQQSSRLAESNDAGELLNFFSSETTFDPATCSKFISAIIREHIISKPPSGRADCTFVMFQRLILLN
jgi:hypothetical protein